MFSSASNQGLINVPDSNLSSFEINTKRKKYSSTLKTRYISKDLFHYENTLYSIHFHVCSRLVNNFYEFSCFARDHCWKICIYANILSRPGLDGYLAAVSLDIYTYKYIYIYIDRERKRERDMKKTCNRRDAKMRR